jgi:DnaJ-domain-containing protein 1
MTSSDPFSILGLPRQFNLTPAQVATAHLRAVSRLHPDRALDPVERERLVREAAAAGAAKQRLSHDTSRAEELLELLGARSFTARPLSPAFLMETLEIREAIEDACGGSEEARAALDSNVAELRRAELAALQEAFAGVFDGEGQGARVAAGAGSAGPSDALAAGASPALHVDLARNPALRAQLEAAADSLVRLRYLDRMVARLSGDL